MVSSSSRFKIIAAFAAVFLIWGSTYLAIRIAVQSFPPFLMAGIRFVIAGAGLYLYLHLKGAPKPTFPQWRSTTIVGFMLLLLGNGGVCWAEQFVTSGITALLLSITPLWFVALEWWSHKMKPTGGVIAGLILGTVGVMVLIDPAELVGGERVDLAGAFALLVATIAWVWGSLYSKRADMPSSPIMATAMEMLTGGVLLTIFGIIIGELPRFHLSSIDTPSLLAVGYLIVFGSLIAFTSYIYLLSHVQASLVSTYAYVNPVIAVFLGWLIADEPLGPRTILAAIIIVAAVAAITTMNIRKKAVPA